MVNRYNFELFHCNGGDMTPDAQGEYVSYEDYEDRLIYWKEHVRLLQHDFDAMAAENAALKEFGEKLNDMHNNLNGEGTGIQGLAEVACQQVALEAAMEEFDTIKSPATDAYLNSVRAEAISSFWEKSLCDVGMALNDIRAFDDSSEAGEIVHSEIKERVDDFVEFFRSGKQFKSNKGD